MSEKTTEEVAQEMGYTRKAIIAYLRLHPELKPARRLHPSRDFLWTDEEIEQFRAWPKGKGGPSKKGGIAVPNNELLSINKVADLLKITPYAVRAMIRNNEIPATLLGTVYRIKQKDVEKFLAKKK